MNLLVFYSLKKKGVLKPSVTGGQSECQSDRAGGRHYEVHIYIALIRAKNYT